MSNEIDVYKLYFESISEVCETHTAQAITAIEANNVDLALYHLVKMKIFLEGIGKRMEEENNGV